MTPIQQKILNYNRNPELDSWYTSRLNELIQFGFYSNEDNTQYYINQLVRYRRNNVSTVVVGISGGIDSALTAAMFKKAGYRVLGVLMPIDQNPEETQRGLEVCSALGIEQVTCDLSEQYHAFVESHVAFDPLLNEENKKGAIRRGNIRARLRMITLYNFAALHGGFVASTDNFSELAAGFWTLHGDVGDVAPIQSLTKSWEVPLFSEYMGLPASVLKAVPTDGLGISAGDEEQLGVSYLEFDIVLLHLLNGYDFTGGDFPDSVNTVLCRIKNTSFKRNNPHNIPHSVYRDRIETINTIL